MRQMKLRGVCTHNLKHVDLALPLGELICFTGPSGSGKSSLAFDTIYREGRRRYLKALALGEHGLSLDPPVPLKEASGLPPTVALEQKIPALSPRSTVGTMTGLLDFLRVLFAELGRITCPVCGQEVRPQSLPEIVASLLALPEGTKLYLLAPLRQASLEVLRYLQAEGFSRFLIDGRLLDLTEEEIPPSLREAQVLVDRLALRADLGSRLSESLRLAVGLSGGPLKVQLLGGGTLSFTTRWICPFCYHCLPEIRPETFSFNHPAGACAACGGLGEKEASRCPVCQGGRLRQEATLVRLGGLSFSELGGAPLREVLSWFEGLSFAGVEGRIFQGLQAEIAVRLEALLALSLEHLEPFRPVTRLSLGELQRLRLATLLAVRLSGCLYVLDEPGLGLSPQEKEALLSFLQRLVAQGNTVIMVEHDLQFIQAAGVVVECGPGAGEQGGQVLFVGSAEELAQRPDLPTGAYLAGEKRLVRRHHKRGQLLSLETSLGKVELMPGGLCVLCGPSGAGKTRLLEELAVILKNRGDAVEVVHPAGGRGLKAIPVSYIGAFTPLRELFARLPEARLRGFRAAHFSFFSKEGRCPECKGEGWKEVRVPLAPPLRVLCEACGGKRYHRDVLEVRYRGFHIAAVLDLTASEARALFCRVPAVSERLALLEEVGLGYLRLGQPLASLSGGERQRLVLARILARRSRKEFLLLDVPTLGLHFSDVERLLALFDRLLLTGFTLVVADNHPALVLLADHLLEVKKGQVVFAGTPREWMERKSEFARRFDSYRSLVAWRKN